MGVVGAVLVTATVVTAGWAGYKTGWEARGHEQAAFDASERRWMELSFIFSHDSEAELVKLDRQFACNSAWRLRNMSPEAIAKLRALEGPLGEGLSDWLAARERRTVRIAPGLAEAIWFERSNLV